MNADCECSTREGMLQKIMAYKFSMSDLGLYLDTHPEDERALCLHNQYAKESQALSNKYQEIYGPLTMDYPCNKWRWIEQPWPWEMGC